MDTDLLQQRWDAYLTAYTDLAPAERERLLRLSVAEDVVSSNPGGETRGLPELTAHIEWFQQHRPGAYFQCHSLLAHHGQLLSHLTLHGRDGTALGSTQTYARFNEEGRFTQLTGFFQPPADAPAEAKRTPPAQGEAK